MFKKGTERGGPVKVAAGTPADSAAGTAAAAGHTKARGDAAEDRALAALLREGLTLIQRNYRVARGPQARGGEVDLVMRDREGTLVFVEVRQRSSRRQGGAAASVGAAKQRSLIFAAQCYLNRLPSPPPCRFDVVAIDGEHIEWLRAAFDA